MATLPPEMQAADTMARSVSTSHDVLDMGKNLEKVKELRAGGTNLTDAFLSLEKVDQHVWLDNDLYTQFCNRESPGLAITGVTRGDDNDLDFHICIGKGLKVVPNFFGHTWTSMLELATSGNTGYGLIYEAFSRGETPDEFRAQLCQALGWNGVSNAADAFTPDALRFTGFVVVRYQEGKENETHFTFDAGSLVSTQVGQHLYNQAHNLQLINEAYVVSFEKTLRSELRDLHWSNPRSIISRIPDRLGTSEIVTPMDGLRSLDWLDDLDRIREATLRAESASGEPLRMRNQIAVKLVGDLQRKIRAQTFNDCISEKHNDPGFVKVLALVMFRGARWEAERLQAGHCVDNITFGLTFLDDDPRRSGESAIRDDIYGLIRSVEGMIKGEVASSSWLPTPTVPPDEPVVVRKKPSILNLGFLRGR